MFQPAPLVDERTAESFYEEVRERLATTGVLAVPDGAAEALIRIFARYGEMVVERLNRVPEKNLYAFLNLLGVSPVPASPARVPLTFTAVDGTNTLVRVPARTLVAAPPEQGETEPVLFETERALELTPGKLVGMFYLDPSSDTEVELSALANTVVPSESVPFAVRRGSDHVLYLGHARLFGLAQGAHLRISVDADGAVTASGPVPVVQWGVQAGEKIIPLQPASDTTEGLTRSGEVIFDNLPAWPEQVFRGIESRWLVARLVTPLPAADANARNLGGIRVAVEVRTRNVPVAAAFAGYQTVDLTKDFFPLTARPIFGSTLYLGSPAFSHPGARVTLNVKLTNPFRAEENGPLPPVFTEGHPRLRWEVWNGAEWIGLSETDSTKGFRIDGAIGFTMPEESSPVKINGVDGYWIRVRLIAGNYGEEERWETSALDQAASGPKRIPATLSPPVIQTLTVDYEITAPPEPPEATISLNQRVYDDLSANIRSGTSVRPFRVVCLQPALYLGFEAPRSEIFVDRMLTCYLPVGEETSRPYSRAPARGEEFELRWEYLGSLDWQILNADDDTQSLMRSGIVSFVVPDDAASQTNIDGVLHGFWFRLSAVTGDSAPLERIRGLVPNTAMATHSLQVEKEILGSSDGTPLQSFVAARSPILREVEVQIREASLPSEADRILRAVGPENAELERDRNGAIREVWVRWQEAEDLLLSRSDQRHFALDRDSGEIFFGDGRHGMIPPRGSNNVRLRRYQVGGGTCGNKPPHAINQLRTAIPYIQSVTNYASAKGGFDAEPLGRVVDRGARLARHRGRAVTLNDFEDLARLASAEVAKAMCVPMRDLVRDPDGRQFFLGTVSLLIVSCTDSSTGNDRPVNSTELLDGVRHFLDDRRDLATDLIIASPDFVPVSVEVEFVPERREDTGFVQATIQDSLTAYLHPVHGGSSGEGWDFGQLPQRAELHGLCTSIPGVQSIRSLRMVAAEERTGSLSAGYFLICSGVHKVKASAFFAEALSWEKQKV